MENIIKLKEAVSKVKSKKEVLDFFNLCSNGKNYKKLNNLLIKNNIDIGHFDKHGSYKKIKYPIIVKTCPVCGEKFKTGSGSPREKTVCSHGCSNTYFRSKENNPNFGKVSESSETYYKSVCFSKHEKKCIICGESNIVAVHHFDENHNNNSIENLIPLCMTHHVYMHSKYKHLILRQIEQYIANFKNKHTNQVS